MRNVLIAAAFAVLPLGSAGAAPLLGGDDFDTPTAMVAEGAVQGSPGGDVLRAPPEEDEWVPGMPVRWAEDGLEIASAVDLPLTGQSAAASAVVGVDQSPVAAVAVPEPATWALLLSGFGLIGWALRRQPREAVFA